MLEEAAEARKKEMEWKGDGSGCEIGALRRGQERPYWAVAMRPGAGAEAKQKTSYENLDERRKASQADTDKANYRRDTITVRYYKVHCTRVQ